MRWLIYPYTSKFIPVIKNKELFKEGETAGLSAPLGFSLEGKDGLIWGEEASGYQVRQKVDTEIDGIWITPEIANMSVQEITEAIKALPVKGKKIYYSGLLGHENESLLLELLQYLGAEEIMHRKNLTEDFELSSGDFNYYKLQTPVIAVAGAGTFTQKFDLQLYLRSQLLNAGYRVSQIGTRPYCEMLGFHSMPDWMFNTEYTDYEKVYAFNHYLRSIEIKEEPEVIILGIPEGIIPFNEKHSQGFGLKAFEICAAVHPDYLLMSLHHGEYTQEFYSEMKNLIKYRMHTEVDRFYISNYVPVSTSFKREQLVFTHSDTLNENKEVSSYHDLKDSRLADRIVDKLSIYEEYEVI